jgi:hypothetical protein
LGRVGKEVVVACLYVLFLELCGGPEGVLTTVVVGPTASPGGVTAWVQFLLPACHAVARKAFRRLIWVQVNIRMLL